MRVNMYCFVKKYVNADNVRIVLMIIPLSLMLFKQLSRGTFQYDKFLDTSILVSFMIAFICEGIASIISKVVVGKSEDEVKLTTDYNRLVKKYSANTDAMIKYDNAGKESYLPEIVLFESRIEETDKYDYTIEKVASSFRYSVPKQVADNSDRLLKAHSHSQLYNSIKMRISDFELKETNIIITYGITTYYDSLLTNRAMDYPFDGNRTVREIYEPGPTISNLRNSKLSNHIGFNGFVELSDGNIVFVKRKKYLSTAKGLWQPSVTASLKVAIRDDTDIAIEDIEDAIKMELKIKVDDKKVSKLRYGIFSFYRDLVEGGKPQFVFYLKLLDMDTNSFKNNFYNSNDNEDEKYKIGNKKKNTKTDGNRFVFISIDELSEYIFKPDRMIDLNGKIYRMTPSYIASIKLLLRNYG